jgi:hypothetical protein
MKEKCRACHGTGCLAADNDEHGVRIEKCDACGLFETDEAAVDHVYAVFMKAVDRVPDTEKS